MQQVEQPVIAKTPPRVFISYTHETPAHKAWVGSLATRLRSNGIDVVLDQWELSLGEDITLFMEAGIRSSERVLLVCTPTYKRKAEDGTGGVGYERLVVTGELARHISTTKFICVLRDGNSAESLPSFLSTRKYTSFVDDATFDDSFDELIRELHNAPHFPKPPLGSNPFESVQSHSAIKAETENGLLVAEEVFSKGQSLLERSDFIGWKRLMRRIRGELPISLLAWRVKVESQPLDDEKWQQSFDQAIGIFSPLLVSALVAVDSELPQVANQNGLLDDLLTVNSWNRSGLSIVIDAPKSFAYVFHHLLGSFLVTSGRIKDAVELLQIPITDEDRRITRKLWQHHYVMGWPQSLNRSCVAAWDFLISLYDTQTWLQHFFISKNDYAVSLSGYSIVASLLELGDRIAGKSDEPFTGSLNVPPTFLRGRTEQISFTKAVRKAVPSAEALNLIATSSGLSAVDMRGKWKTWVEKMVEWHQRSGDHFFSVDTIPELP